eukprot:gene13977-15433_t
MEEALPIFVKDFGMTRMINNDRISSLCDQIILLIFPYLDFMMKKEKMNFITCNCYLYQTWIRKVREITLSKQQSILNYFIDDSYRSQIDARLEDPSKQLSIVYNNDINVDLSTYPMKRGKSGGFKQFYGSIRLFLELVRHVPERVERIEELDLLNFGDEVEEGTPSQYLESNLFKNYFHTKFIHSLHLRDFWFPLDDDLGAYALRCPENVVELNLMNCTGETVIPSPSLKKLCLIWCNIENIDEIASQLDEIKICRNGDTGINLNALRTVKKVSLDATCQIYHYESLQDNEEIHLEFEDSSNVDLSKCFKNTKKIELQFSGGKIKVDLSYYEKVQSWVLYNFSNDPLILIEESLFSKNFPTTLQKLHLDGISNLTSLRFLNSFPHNLRKVKIMNCSSFESCEGLWNIESVKLSSLPKLRSLKGLGGEKTLYVELHDVPLIEDINDL